MIVDRRLASDLIAALNRFLVVTQLGPRQVGKTTLALQVARAGPDASCCSALRRRSSSVASPRASQGA